jgi:hypothetical protein
LSKEADQLRDLADARFAWIQVLTALRTVLMQAEAAQKAALTTPDNGGTNTDVGVWVEVFDPVLPAGSFFSAGDEGGGSAVGGMSARSRRDIHMRGGAANRPHPQVPLTAAGDTVDLGAISQVNLSFRGVNRNNISPNANSDLAYQVQHVMTNSPAFKAATFQGDLTVDMGNTNTFTFMFLVTLTHPLKL